MMKYISFAETLDWISLRFRNGVRLSLTSTVALKPTNPIGPNALTQHQTGSRPMAQQSENNNQHRALFQKAKPENPLSP